MRIGVPQSGYGAERNIPRIEGLEYVRPWDVHRVMAGWDLVRGREMRRWHLFTFSEPHLPRVDLLHFFNSIAFGRTPWVTTYESLIPRWYDEVPDARIHEGIDRLLDGSCRRLIGFSEAAVGSFEEYVHRMGRGDVWGELLGKNTVLHPPQALLPERERAEGPVRFAFVGADFYRKGGLECLKALHRLHAAGVRGWHFDVVGKVGRWENQRARTTEADGREAMRLLAAMSDAVSYRESVPHAEVLEGLGRSHYLLFPTFQDTYGYVVLEAMAAGCVPVATRTRSLPEVIVDGVNGVLIDVPVDAVGDAHDTATTAEEKARLVDALEAVLRGVLAGGHAEWAARSAAARDRIRAHHDPGRHRDAVRAVYEAALG